MGLSIRSWSRRLQDSIRQEGLVGFARRAAVSPFYRAAVLGSIPLETYLSETGLPAVALRNISKDDVESLIALRPEYSGVEVASRLGRGHKCFVIEYDGADAGCFWSVTGEAAIQDTGLVLPLHQDELVMYEVYMRPEHREGGVFAAARQPFDRTNLERGFRARITFATLGRRPFGVRGRPHRVAVLRVLRLGPFRRFWVRTYGPQAEYWRERLKELRWA